MKLRLIFVLVVIFVLTACSQAPATPETILATQIVEVEGEPQLIEVTVIVEVTAPPGIEPPSSGGGAVAPTIAPTPTIPPNLTFALSSNPRWQQIEADDMPPARFDHTITLDSVNDKLVLFGGRNGSATLNDTWVYDLTSESWHEVTSSTAPSARHGHAAAFDPTLERVLIFAGQADSIFGDVWAFDIASETWQELVTGGSAPAPRYGTSAVIDVDANQMIITHGFASTRFDDTFALDLNSNEWSLLEPTAARPLNRCLHESVYDAQSGQMILFGGCSSGFGPCPQGDLWLFDTEEQSWVEMVPDSIRPSARSNAALAGDDAGHVLLFGGNTSDGASADLWLLDLDAGEWIDLTTDDGPPARYSHDATWDPANGQLIVFGGRGSQGALDDMWLYTP